jgi:hypothetical protein
LYFQQYSCPRLLDHGVSEWWYAVRMVVRGILRRDSQAACSGWLGRGIVPLVDAG